jgi:glycogen debranching enzyme
MLIHELWRWGVQLEELRPLMPHVDAALDWMAGPGDPDGDGYIEYQRRSKNGLESQSWKDSWDSMRFRDGLVARSPIATAEVQGYAYDARVRTAELARRVWGDEPLAVELEAEAEALKARFNQDFFLDGEGGGHYVLGLDHAKQPIDSLCSNIGHLLWSGIVDEPRAGVIAEQLMSHSLNSGWGVRTMSDAERGFNPIGYHTGTVWPHDNSIAAAGLKRYGFQDDANRLVSNVFEAAQQFTDFRLPELFCGFDRGLADVPVPYPVACSPQAWSAGATFMFLSTMLGLRAHADRRELELLRPNLPDWLGKCTVTNLRIGDASVDLLFHRWRGTTSAEVLRKVGDVSVTIRL